MSEMFYSWEGITMAMGQDSIVNQPMGSVAYKSENQVLVVI